MIYFSKIKDVSRASDICRRNTIIDVCVMLSSIKFDGRKFLKTYNLHSVVDFIPFTPPPVVCHSFEAGWAVRVSAAYTSLPPHSVGLPSARVLDTKYFPFCPRVTPRWLLHPPLSHPLPPFFALAAEANIVLTKKEGRGGDERGLLQSLMGLAMDRGSAFKTRR